MFDTCTLKGLKMHICIYCVYINGKKTQCSSSCGFKENCNDALIYIYTHILD